MNIRYTLHALERMRQRGIESSRVEECLRNHDREESLGGDYYKCVKRINGRVIVVIYKREDSTIIIITAYVSSKIHKYLSNLEL